MQTPSQLVPGITADEHDRLVYWVESRSVGSPRRVDMQEKDGLGECGCQQYAYSPTKNKNCYHLTRVRMLLSCALAQSQMMAEEED